MDPGLRRGDELGGHITSLQSLPRLLVGLGNPDSKYFSTRHNVGREFVESLAEGANKSFKKTRQAEILRLPDFFGISLAAPLVLARLTSFMNESGPALQGLLAAEHIDMNEILVVTDDFMIPFGSLRLRPQGSDGGHNGLKSIISAFGTNEFSRLRMGIGPVPEREDPADYVLKKFSKTEMKTRPEIFAAAKEGLKVLFEQGTQKAMSVLNKQHVGSAS